MKYKCLRDCFVSDRFHREGEIYDLPDNVPISEKNFKTVEGAPEPAPAPKAEKKAPPVKPDVIPAGQYWCGKCKSLHRETSKTGKKHLKFKE